MSSFFFYFFLFFSFFFFTHPFFQPFAFKASKPGSRVFSFAADSEEDRTKWLVAMTDAAEKLQSTVG